MLGLEASVRSLQTQLQASEKKAKISERTIENISEDRDSAVQQLGIAYVTIEQLKAENEGIRAENEDLKRLVAQFNAQDDETTRQLPENQISRKDLLSGDHPKRVAVEKNDSAMGARGRDITGSQGNTVANRAESEWGDPGDASRLSANGENVTRNQQRNVLTKTGHEKDALVKTTNARDATGNQQKDDKTTQDLTYLSFLDVRLSLLFLQHSN